MSEANPILASPSPDPLFDAIGRVAYAWSNLEAELGRILVAVLHAPMAAVLTTGENYSVVYGHLKALVNLAGGKYEHGPRLPLEDDHRVRLETELAVVNALSARRNKIVHGLWLPQPGSTGEQWYNLRRQRHRQMMPLEPITISEMLAISNEIEAAATRVQRLGANIDHEVYGRVTAPGFDDDGS